MNSKADWFEWNSNWVVFFDEILYIHYTSLFFYVVHYNITKQYLFNLTLRLCAFAFRNLEKNTTVCLLLFYNKLNNPSEDLSYLENETHSLVKRKAAPASIINSKLYE